MIAFLWNLVSFIIALGILVAVHEWGHFWVARRCGVKVQRFSIGFGKALWRTTDSLGTEYVIAAIPLGGYVKMLDERVEQVKEADLPYAFNRQPVLKRIAIVSAGPIVNFLFAVLAMYFLLLIGEQAVKPVIGDVQANSIASQAGVQTGDEIIALAGRETLDWQEVNYEIMGAIGDASVPMQVSSSAGYTRTIELDLTKWQFDPEKQSALASLGIIPFVPKATNQMAMVEKYSPGYNAGLRENDLIVGFNGTPVEKWEQTVELIEQHPLQDVAITIEREGEIKILNATVGVKSDGSGKGLLGVISYREPWPEDYIFVKQYGPIDALFQGVDSTWRLITLSLDMLGKLFTGDVSVKNLSGPISIAQGAGMSASYGIVAFLGFLALISVNLGIINLLPLPVLDGGHLLYYFIELLTGRPVSESVQEVGFKIGGIILILLMAVAFYNDIARL
ncbi:sigma E protease regulator RseP [Aliiglaciecola sp. LCG003]|uniref:sigma E protease regulator RseP n=1 Tax=Aliiglaciecola sp. LCG003 TaxID=3053655 RepID=UPI0025727BED|nr:sigma E protease regulator RseP [Aliiglaciecola sp. LCG003]WJG08529.1 sigma E protease regulator RseP [Aliiglaciecola sp. LCG003]